MEKNFKNVAFWIDTLAEDNNFPLMIGCKDREVKHYKERWVYAALTIEEARELYEFLREYLETKEP